MCNCENEAEEEKEITQELSYRLIEVLNEFSDEYHGNLLGHHMITSTGAVLATVFKSCELPGDKLREYCQWLLEKYSKDIA